MPQDSTSNTPDETDGKPTEWETLPTRAAPGPPRASDLADSFPQLEIMELLGQGGMGYVYKARQKGLDRLVALKLLPHEVSTDANFSERFEREARALAKLSHPGIVVVYDSGPLNNDSGRPEPVRFLHDRLLRGLLDLCLTRSREDRRCEKTPDT